MGTIRIKLRGFKSGKLVWEREVVFIDSVGMDRIIPTLAAEHVEEIKAGTLGMVEMEFLDEADPMHRFFRIGVEPEGMVMPLRIDLDKEPTN